MSALPQLDLIQQPQKAAALLHPLRLRILQALRQPGSASSVADQLGLPRQRVNYHLRQLEKDGLVQFLEERRKGNCVERIVRATASHFLITPEVLGELAVNPEEIQDRFSSTYLVAVAARTIRELAALRAAADAAGKRLATLTLQTDIAFASPAKRNAFADELTTEVARLAAKYHDEGAADARRFRLLLGVHPKPVDAGEAAGRPADADTESTADADAQLEDGARPESRAHNEQPQPEE